MGQTAGYVSADYLRKAAELGRHIKQRTYDMMALAPGNRVLDVGCGPGADTVALAQRVGGKGQVIGIDRDPEMIAQADAAARESGVADRVRHHTCNAAPLPFPDQSFDATRAERLLQVLPEPALGHAAFAEMVRVTRVGGAVVIADTDWASASVDFSDPALERRMLDFFARRLRPNGYAGRELYALAQRHGLGDVRIEVFPLVHLEPSMTPYLNWLPEEAVRAGVISAAEAAAWQHELTQRVQAGTFFATVNMLAIAGRRTSAQ